tara:strand:- start:71 stop:217 length:147 start_codon:yes stop_codon:yes gene_type:complete
MEATPTRAAEVLNVARAAKDRGSMKAQKSDLLIAESIPLKTNNLSFYI